MLRMISKLTILPLWLVAFLVVLDRPSAAFAENYVCTVDQTLTNGWWHVADRPTHREVIGVGYEIGATPEDRIPYIRTSFSPTSSAGAQATFHILTNWIVVPITNGVPIALEFDFLVRSVSGHHAVSVFVAQPDPKAAPGELPAIFTPAEDSPEIAPTADGSWYPVTGRISLCNFTNYFGKEPLRIDQSPRAHPLLFGIYHTSDGRNSGLPEFDYAEVSFCHVSEPPVAILIRKNTPSGFSLSWGAVPGRRYSLLRSLDIGGGQWDKVDQRVADSAVMSFETPNSAVATELFKVEYSIETGQ